MKTFVLACFCIVLIACKNGTVQPDSIEKPTTELNSFILHGSVDQGFLNKVYLHKIIGNNVIVVDSTSISDLKFSFKGSVDTPERFGMSFDNHNKMAVFVLENKEMDISFNANTLNEPIIKGSELNDELSGYKAYAKSIFKKIDFLFPEFQKARLNNNADRLAEIGSEMQKIEDEFRIYSYNYIENHPNSFVSAMILSDQLKASTIDTLKIAKYYKQLSLPVQQGIDGMLIGDFLKLN